MPKPPSPRPPRARGSSIIGKERPARRGEGAPARSERAPRPARAVRERTAAADAGSRAPGRRSATFGDGGPPPSRTARTARAEGGAKAATPRSRPAARGLRGEASQLPVRAPRPARAGGFRDGDRPAPLPLEARVARALREGVTSESTRWVTERLMEHDVSPAELAAAIYQVLGHSPRARPTSDAGGFTARRPARERSSDRPGRSAPAFGDPGRPAARPRAGAPGRAEGRRPGDGRAGSERRPAGTRSTADRPRGAWAGAGGEEAPARPRVKGGPGARRVTATTPARGPRQDRPGGITGFAREAKDRED